VAPSSQRAKDNLEKALTSLHLTFGWQEEDLFILEAESLTGGSQMTIGVIIREHSIQLSTPVYFDLTPEQTSVIIWEEWRRRAEPTFCLLPEAEGDPALVAVRIPRVGDDSEKPKALAEQIRAAIMALDRSREKVGLILDDVLVYEAEEASEEDASA
jgi:hypothetical protein